MGILIFWLKQRKKKNELDDIHLNVTRKEISLEEFENAIIENNLTTVDSIADHFETNTVQLNRIFKNFETTPGKFLKQVKLEIIKKMLKEKVDLEKISKKVGYSTSYIKKELNL